MEDLKKSEEPKCRVVRDSNSALYPMILDDP